MSRWVILVKLPSIKAELKLPSSSPDPKEKAPYCCICFKHAPLYVFLLFMINQNVKAKPIIESQRLECHFLCITESFSFSLIICLGFFFFFFWLNSINHWISKSPSRHKETPYLFIYFSFFFPLVLLKNDWQISLYTFKACRLMVWFA